MSLEKSERQRRRPDLMRMEGLDGQRWRTNRRLAPQPCVVAVQAGTQRPARHKQLGAGVVVAVRVDRVGEGMNVREVTPPRLVVILKTKADVRAGGTKSGVAVRMEGRAYHPAFPRRQLQDAFPRTFAVTAGEIRRLLQESLGADVVEQQRAEAGAHRHDVLVEAHRTDP